MATRDDDKPFLSRWSRLKRTRAAEEEAASAAPPGEPAGPVEEKTEAEILEELGLPDPDTLEPGDDFSGFMARAVPEAVRRRALRKLWLSNPVLANLDELVEYGENYTDAATVVENLASAWQAGRGYLFEEPDESGKGAGKPAATDAPEETALAAETPEASTVPDSEPPDAPAPEPAAESPEPRAEAPAPRRRVRFTVPDRS